MMNAKALPKSSQFAIRVALGPSGSAVILTINHWLSDNGKEWTVTRLKALRTAAMQLRAGNHDLVRMIYRENSIAYRKDTLIPRGHYHHVFTLFLHAMKPAVLRRLEVVLRVYTSLRLEELSEKQYNKAQKAICTPYQGTVEALDRASVLTIVGMETLLNGIAPSIRHSLFWSDGAPKIRKAKLTRMKAYTGTHSGLSVPRDFRTTPYGRAALSIVSCTCWPQSLYETGVCDTTSSSKLRDFIRSRVWSPGTDNDHAGHIGFIQEVGAKARVVAVPSALLQWGFEPLHDWLDRLIQAVPTSCVHDQNKGAWFIQAALETDIVVYSFDLSSATDRYPRSLQTRLLRYLKLNSYADALEEIANEDWRVSTNTHKVEAWNYGCGQPMGLYSSFPLFSLAHTCLLEGICKRLGVTGDRPYRLIGDDVVITDRNVACEYHAILESLQIEISPQKTMKSSKVAEFAGFVGYRTNKSVAIFRPYKHTDTNRIHNPVGLIYSCGSALRRTGSDYWSSKVKDFQLTRRWRNPDLSPLFKLQEERGGVNPPLLDTTRLENLLNAAMLHSGSARDSWTQEEYDLFDLEDLCAILLDKQDTGLEVPVRAPMELLATPVNEKTEMSYSPTVAIRHDPLMSESARELVASQVRLLGPTIDCKWCLRTTGRCVRLLANTPCLDKCEWYESSESSSPHPSNRDSEE